MHYPDLSPYEYSDLARQRVERYALSGASLLNVGWLDPAHTFPVGPAPAGFLDALWDLLLAEPGWNRMRGYHLCPFCPQADDRVDRSLGACEVFVIGADAVYIAPDLVFHYVEAHEYLPPARFIDAVMSGRTQQTLRGMSGARWARRQQRQKALLSTDTTAAPPTLAPTHLDSERTVLPPRKRSEGG